VADDRVRLWRVGSTVAQPKELTRGYTYRVLCRSAGNRLSR
jgi:hypothetical protein